MPKLDKPMAFLDIEATGVDPVADRIIEFAVVVTDGVKRKSWSSRFNPGFPIPESSTKIHGITDADVAACADFKSMAPKIHAGLQGKDLVTYNGWSLDLPMLDEEFRRADLKLDLTGVRVIDCAGIFFNKEPRDLEAAVRKFCGREHVNSHGALADAEATAEVMAGQLAAYPDLAAMDIDALAAFSMRGDYPYADIAHKLYIKDGELFWAFGKNRDRAVLDDIGFARWVISKDFPGSTREVLIQALKDAGEWM